VCDMLQTMNEFVGHAPENNSVRAMHHWILPVSSLHALHAPAKDSVPGRRLLGQNDGEK
jgi:hypothetical protein